MSKVNLEVIYVKCKNHPDYKNKSYGKWYGHAVIIVDMINLQLTDHEMIL